MKPAFFVVLAAWIYRLWRDRSTARQLDERGAVQRIELGRYASGRSRVDQEPYGQRAVASVTRDAVVFYALASAAEGPLGELIELDRIDRDASAEVRVEQVPEGSNLRALAPRLLGHPAHRGLLIIEHGPAGARRRLLFETPGWRLERTRAAAYSLRQALRGGVLPPLGS